MEHTCHIPAPPNSSHSSHQPHQPLLLPPPHPHTLTRPCTLGLTRHTLHRSIEFWRFSYDDMAQYDLPAELQYIRDVTGVERISYIGHSQGSTIMLAALASQPKLEQQVGLWGCVQLCLLPAATSLLAACGCIAACDCVCVTACVLGAAVHSCCCADEVLAVPMFAHTTMMFLCT